MTGEKTQKQMILETHDAVIRLETVLPYMAEDIKDNKENIENLSHSHGRLKKNFWLLVGLLVGSGVITGGVMGVLNA